MSDADAHVLFCLTAEGTGEVAPVEIEPGEVCYSCRPSPQRAEAVENEDGALGVTFGTEGVLLAVVDGVGGHGNGGLAAKTVVEHLQAAVGQAGSSVPGLLGGRIVAALEGANAALVEATGNPAATVAVVTVFDGELRTYHAGDAEFLVVGQRGRIKLHTIKHGPVGYAEAAGMLEEDAARRHDERHLISNMVGMTGMRIEMNTAVSLSAFDTVVVGSDGLFDKLSRDEIAQIVRAGPLVDATVALEAAVDARAADDGHGDDCTFVLFRQSR